MPFRYDMVTSICLINSRKSSVTLYETAVLQKPLRSQLHNDVSRCFTDNHDREPNSAIPVCRELVPAPVASYTHQLWGGMPPEAWSCKDQFSLYYVGIRRVNYSALLSNALETLLVLVLSQDQDPAVVCTDFIFVNVLLKPGYEVVALCDTEQSFQYSWQCLN